MVNALLPSVQLPHNRKYFFYGRREAGPSGQHRMLPGVRVVYPDKYLCGESVCAYGRDGQPLYFDSNHLNSRGLRELLPLLQETLG